MNNPQLAILGLIAEQPQHGYQIEATIEARGMRAWTEIGFSSIYHLLKKLEQAEYITAQLEPAPRGPARKIYTITPAGRAALREGIIEALATPHHSYPPLQVGLANIPILTPTEATGALTRHRDALTAQIVAIQQRLAELGQMPWFVTAMFDHSLALLTAERDWLAKLINQQQNPTQE